MWDTVQWHDLRFEIILWWRFSSFLNFTKNLQFYVLLKGDLKRKFLLLQMKGPVDWEEILLKFFWYLISFLSYPMILSVSWWRHFVCKLLGFYMERSCIWSSEGYSFRRHFSWVEKMQQTLFHQLMWPLERHFIWRKSLWLYFPLETWSTLYTFSYFLQTKWRHQPIAQISG